jgi:hypothetical protein
MMTPEDHWQRVMDLITELKDSGNPVMKEGTPAEVLGYLRSEGFTLEDLVQIQGDLEQIAWDGSSIRFWFWMGPSISYDAGSENEPPLK